MMKQGLGIVLLVLLLTACTTTGKVTQLPLQAQAPHEPSQSEPTIKIGTILILSGIGADWGTATLNGETLAIADVNAAGGIDGRKLELVAQDNPSDAPATGISALRALQNQGIHTIIGTTWSTSAWAVMPLACDDHTVLISATVGTPQFAQACDYTFNVYAADTLMSEDLGRQLVAHGYKRLGVLGSQESWQGEQARAVKKGFEHAGGTVVAFDLTLSDQKEFNTEALKIVSQKPDVVFVLPNFGAIATAGKTLRAAGYTGALTSVYLDGPTIANAQGAFEDAIIPTSVTPTPAFQTAYRAAYNADATIGADTGYDAVMLLAQAMRETKSTDPTVLTEYLKTVRHFSGVSGELSFDEDGGAQKSFAYERVKQGTLVPYEWN